MKIMFIKKKFINRHRILQVLQEYLDENNRPDKLDVSEIQLSWSELVEKSKLTDKEVYAQIDYLSNENEIHVDEINFTNYYFIKRTGSISYFDKKYLEQGKKAYLDILYDYLKIISGVALLIIALITFFLNIMDTRKNGKEIEKLKMEISDLKKKD